MIIYPVIELADLFYAHEYGWLDALVEATEGVLLRPEPRLRRVFKSGFTIREYLARRGLRAGGLKINYTTAVGVVCLGVVNLAGILGDSYHSVLGRLLRMF